MGTRSPRTSFFSSLIASIHWKGIHGDVGWQITERVVRIVFAFLLNILIARLLGPETFGTYSYALSYVALFGFLGQAGLESLLLRELIQNRQAAPAILATGLALRVSGALIAAASSLALTVIVLNDDTGNVVPLVLILSISGLIQAGWVIEIWLQANHCFRAVASVKITAYVLSATLRVTVLSLPHPLIWLAAVNVLESTLCLIGMWHAARKCLGLHLRQLQRPSLGSLKKMAALITPMVFAAFTTAIYSRFDVLMLGYVSGVSAAGHYTAASLLSEGFYIIPASLMAAAAPRLASIFVSSPDQFDKALSGFLWILSWTGLAIALLTTLLSPVAVPIIFGDTYAQTVEILQIHIWSTWMVFISVASDSWYINRDLRKLYLAKTATAAAVNLILNLTLIPNFNGKGAAIATVISYAVSAIGFGLAVPVTRRLARIQVRALIGLR
ncbi:flippase [Methylococcus sp. EFPC2]|uniref:flippase n=1 Tax=Methylococcus sp. EFPC2 TaxID=2812648 RepID=UPI001966DA4A|nr:flippase [Methylococcus sp. EFPC2]QSA96833.1 flippase [Methylococcus sp. EFPC2]